MEPKHRTIYHQLTMMNLSLVVITALITMLGTTIVTTHLVKNAVLFNLLQFAGVVAIACIVAMLLSRRMSRKIKNELMGYEPQDFRSLFLRQEGVLEALDEGILAIDRYGKIVYLNTPAAKLFQLTDRQAAMNRMVTDIDPRSTIPRVLESGKAEYNISIDTLPGYPTLSNRIPIRQNGKVVGVIATFRDRTDVTRLAEDLTGFRYMVEAMRAYTHEFMNKLHVLHGLMQMEQYDKAKAYIMDITHTQKLSVSRVMDRIEDSTVAALLVGKTSRATECGIHLTIRQDSTLKKENPFLPSAALVSILGNLIDNAIDSLNLSVAEVKDITITIRQSENGLFLCVEDSGLGITKENLEHIFTYGFSTKGEGRGTGLATVKETVESYHGQIRVETEPQNGTVFYVSFHQSDKE